MRLAHRIHHPGPPATGLAWIIEDGLCWHNGATGRFQSVVAVGEQVAVAALAAYGPMSRDYDPTEPVLAAIRLAVDG